MIEGSVTPYAVVKAVPPKSPEGEKYPALSKNSIYTYATPDNKRVGRGDWLVIEGLLKRIEVAARGKGQSVTIDYQEWRESWKWLEKRNLTGRPGVRLDDAFDAQIVHDSWIGGWDGAAHAFVTHSAGREFLEWPPGLARLNSLSHLVTCSSEAHAPAVALKAAEQLREEAQGKFGANSQQYLAASHAAAFWTGQNGDIRSALQMTDWLQEVCDSCLGDDHLLSRLASLRRAMWESQMGNWRSAHRIFDRVARHEDSREDGDRVLRLLARWGMARTNGRIGNWAHARAELEELLPQVRAVFQGDHAALLDAENSHAWSVGRAGDCHGAYVLLKALNERTQNSRLKEHPTSLRIRLSASYWARAAGLSDEAMLLMREVRKDAGTLLGENHPIYLQAVENEAIFLFEIDIAESIPLFHLVAERRERLLGRRHPYTLHALCNRAAAKSAIDGSAGFVEEFRRLAKEMGAVLGEEHPVSLRAKMNVAIALLEAEGPDAALPLCVQVAESFRLLLGYEHPETAEAFRLFENVRIRVRDRRNYTKIPYPPSSSSYRTFGDGIGNA
ncbi:hypothetical protein [Streptomyces collinus]